MMNDEQRPSQNKMANALMDRFAQAIDDTDEQAAAARVAALRKRRPAHTKTEIADKLIYDKCLQTAVIGAVSSGASVIPGLGTIASLTVGVAADIGLTFKAQAELVLELAALYDHKLEPEEKRRVVMLVTGASAGANAVARRAGNRIAAKAGQKFARKGIVKSIPFVSVAASAATNVAMTYAIGGRAKAYFGLGPDQMTDMGESLRAITGVDERKLAKALSQGMQTARRRLASSSRDLPRAALAAGRSAGQLVGKAGAGVKQSATTLIDRRRLRKAEKERQLLAETAVDEIIPIFED